MTGRQAVRYAHPRRICLVPGVWEGEPACLWCVTPPPDEELAPYRGRGLSEEEERVRWFRLTAWDAPRVEGSIWLEPWCAECERFSSEGRLWSPDDPWGNCGQWRDGGSECRSGSIRYDPVEPGL